METPHFFDEDAGAYENGATRQIKDPIHNYIPVSKSLSKFIDTKQFQRLRNIKQLGTTSFVWPSACHTRFEHCLGVAYLARTMAVHLQKSQSYLDITDRDVDCVEIAGLCHDLGHGPWSHVWDGIFIPDVLPDTHWRHEQGSEMMFDALVRENDTELKPEDQAFVKALIAGDHSRTPHEKSFLFDIVANKRNGLDVDKFDYIHRDSHMIGEPIHLSLSRLVNSARVLDNQICYDIKDANHIYDICVARFKLHKIFYNHKTAKAIEYMIIDTLKAADPYMKISGRIFDPTKFLHLTDNILERIESSEEPEFEKARSIIHRIRTRDLYKCVDYKVVDWPMVQTFRDKVTRDKIIEAVREIELRNPPHLDLSRTDSSATVSSLASEDDDRLEMEDIEVVVSEMHYGMKDENPVDRVRFYSKRRPNECLKAEQGVYSNLVPAHFAEGVLRVYTRKGKYYGLVQAGYREVLQKLEKELSPTSIEVLGVDHMAPTPPATEPPTTPKIHSRNASFTSATGRTTTPFANNEFMTVPKTFTPGSPSQIAKKRKKSKDEAMTNPSASKKLKS